MVLIWNMIMNKTYDIVAYEIGKTQEKLAAVCVIPGTSFNELRNSYYRSASGQLSFEHIDV